MRKISNIAKMLALVPASLAMCNVSAMAADQEPWVMEITGGENDALPNCYFTGEDDQGNIYGFWIDINGGYVYDEETGVSNWLNRPTYVRATGILAKNPASVTSVTFPDYISMEVDGVKYENIIIDEANLRFAYNDTKSFPGMDNLKEIYFPISTWHLNISGHDLFDLMSLHIKRTDRLMDFYFWDDADKWMKIVVPDAVYFDYVDNGYGNNYIIVSESPVTPVYLNVETPGTLAEKIAEVISDIGNIRWAVVSGTPNNDDIRLFRRMYHLETLDLSAVTGIKVFEQCSGLKYLTSIILPPGIEEIGEDALEGASNLATIEIPDNVTKIGDRAFANCRSLRQINFPDGLKVIGREAFSRTGIESIDLKNVEKTEWYAFGDNYNLKSVKMGDKLEEIGPYTFRETSLEEIIIPDNVKNISYGAFEGCNQLKKISLGRNLEYIDGSSFYYCQPDTVVCNILFPLNSCGGFRDTEGVLYVPRLTLNNYMLHDAWKCFKNVLPIPDSDMTDVTLEQPFTLITNYGLADKANITNKSEFTVNRDYPLDLGTYTHQSSYRYQQYWDDMYGWMWGYNPATLLVNSNMSAENVVMSIDLPCGRWHFLSFPFDVKVGEIVVDNNSQSSLWVVRKYSGENRASLEGETWLNMTDDMTLKAGEGYIFHCSNYNDQDFVNFTFKPASNSNAIFTKDAVTATLNQYKSDYPHNDSWNLIGNTYPAYYNIQGLDFDAPITVWENDNYYAYSPLDDNYVLAPFEAFFVQRQDWEGGNVLTMKPAARAANRDDALVYQPIQTRAYAPASDRAIFNLVVKGEAGTDRARVVINEEALMSYESNRDAAKFMSTVENVPQLYVMNNNVSMSIDERPLANGEIILGVRFGVKGQYSISLDTRNAENYSATLLDKKTGATAELASAPYEFEADATTDNDRFVLSLRSSANGSEGTTGINGAEDSALAISVVGNTLSVVSPEDVEIIVVSIDGKTVAAGKGTLSVELMNGIYVVKAGDNTRKVFVGK